MSFYSDVKFLRNLFKQKENLTQIVDEYEKDVETLKTRISQLRTYITYEESCFEELSIKEYELRRKIENLKESVEERKSDITLIHQLENIEFLKMLMKEKKYEMKPLSLEKHLKAFRYDFEYCYEKTKILEVINFQIQNLAAKECISPEKLKKAVFEINEIWLEAFNNAPRYCKVSDSTTRLLITSFTMPKKLSYKEL